MGTIIPAGTFQQNSFYFYESNTADYIESDKPVMVAQFMTGGGCMGGGGVGDPEMIYISPIEQGIKKIGFYRNTRENITTNYLTLIVPTPGVALANDGMRLLITVMLIRNGGLYDRGKKMDFCPSPGKSNK